MTETMIYLLGSGIGYQVAKSPISHIPLSFQIILAAIMFVAGFCGYLYALLNTDNLGLRYAYIYALGSSMFILVGVTFGLYALTS